MPSGHALHPPGRERVHAALGRASGEAVWSQDWRGAWAAQGGAPPDAEVGGGAEWAGQGHERPSMEKAGHPGSTPWVLPGPLQAGLLGRRCLQAGPGHLQGV